MLDVQNAVEIRLEIQLAATVQLRRLSFGKPVRAPFALQLPMPRTWDVPGCPATTLGTEALAS